MKYLNQECQFTRVSDEHAGIIMENLGYMVPTATAAITDLYVCDDRRFALCEEVVEAADEVLYLRLEELEEMSVVEVDESGRESIVESVAFEDSSYELEGVYTDDEGGLFARMVSESAGDPGDEDEEEEETEEAAEEE